MNKCLKKFLNPFYVSFRKIQGRLFPVSRSLQIYKKNIGRKCDLKNPTSLTEKLMYYKINLYWNNDVVSELADKYRVRDFVSKNGLSNILNPIYGCWDKPEDIDWDSLPNKFVLKLNTGSGFNLFCNNKETFDKKKAIKQLKKWLRTRYGTLYVEQGIYSKIEKKIIAEKYIEGIDSKANCDYKFFCSYGDVKFLFVASDRENNMTKFDFYSTKWEWLDIRNYFPNNGPVEKPKNFELMVQYASVLSKRFPLVRVDLYDNDGEIYFGEMTFTHFGCINGFEPDEFDFKFGSMFPDVHKANKIL